MKMNKWTKVLAAMGLAAGISNAASETLWKGVYGPTTSQGGYLFTYTDADNGGSSEAICDGKAIPNGDPADACIGSAGFTVNFNVTTDVACDWEGCKDYGFVGMGMNVKQEEGDEAGSPYDVSGFGQITVEYSSTHPIYMQLTRDEEALAYAVHYVKLSKGSGESLTLDLTDFRQPSWAAEKEDIESILKELTQIKFQAHTENFSFAAASVDFTLKEITLGGGTPSPVVGDLNGFNFEYSVVAGNLVFNVSEALNVEIFDLQGKMVRSGEVSSASNMISLEGLNASSYVVRTDKGQFLLPLVD